MKLYQIPDPDSPGKLTWILTHDLVMNRVFGGSKISYLRLYTFIGHYSSKIKNTQELFYLLQNLEIKANSLNYLTSVLKAKSDQFTPVWVIPNKVQDYSPHLEIISIVDAYLNSIYSLFEIIAKINKQYIYSLKDGFNSQNKILREFKDGENNWYNKFHDIRSELSHYSSSRSNLIGEKLFIHCINKRDKKFFKHVSDIELSISEILSWTDFIKNYLENWAKIKLDFVDQLDVKIPIIFSFDENAPTHRRILVKDVLRLGINSLSH